MYKEVTLPSSGEKIKVKVLPLFGQDHIQPEKEIGPFVYTYRMVTGQSAQAAYDITDMKEKPPKPEVPKEEVREKSPAWFAWAEWETYQAAIAHYNEQAHILERFIENRAHHILDECVDVEDREKIITDEDWTAVHDAALVPVVTEEMVADALSNTFQG